VRQGHVVSHRLGVAGTHLDDVGGVYEMFSDRSAKTSADRLARLTPSRLGRARGCAHLLSGKDQAGAGHAYAGAAVPVGKTL